MKNENEGELNDTEIDYYDLFTGNFPDLKERLIGKMPFLPFGKGPFSKGKPFKNIIDKAEDYVWEGWNRRVSTGSWANDYSEFRGKYTEERKALENAINTAKKTISYVEKGWFPSPP